MSERQSKKRWWRSVTAVVSTVALGIGGVAVPQVAGAYSYNDQIGSGWGEPDGPRAKVIPQMNVVVGDQAKVDAEMAKPLDQRTDDLLGPGIDFTLLAAVQATAPNPVPKDATSQEPGQSDIHADARASEKDGNVTGDDIFHVAFQVSPEIDVTLPENGKAPRFEWDNLTDDEPKLLFWESERLENGNTEFKFYFKDTSTIGYIGPDPVVTFAIPASLKDVAEGQDRPSSVRAAETGLAFVQPAQSWTPLSADAVPLSRCVYESTHRWQFNGGGYGSWLLDANLGTLDRSTRTLKWDVKFFDANGNPLRAIKESIAETADRRIQVWKDSDQGGDSSQDTGGSYYTVDKENPNRPQDPNEVLWQADASWNYNPTTKTGDTWIEDGTIIELTHQTENGDCVQDPNYTVDPNDQSFANVSARVAPRPSDASAEFEWAIHEVIGDYVWYDYNRNGIQDDDEDGAPGVEVTVTNASGDWTVTTETDKQGRYRIAVPGPGEYKVKFSPLRAFTATETEAEGSTPENDSNGLETTVVVSEGQDDYTLDLGLTCDCQLGSIGDRVWIDENGDGKEDPNEKTGVPGVTVIVKDPEGKEVSRTVTDENGNWKVDVVPGDYEVEYVPGKNTPSQPDQVKRNVTIKPGEKRDDVDLGILPSGSVGDRVWNDEDGDGKQGEDEKGLENVIVKVSREGEPTRSAVTDENGEWKIEGLNPDVEYDIRFIKPEGWEVTGKVPGSDESGLVSKVTVKPGEYNASYDLGLKKTDVTCDCEPVKPGRIGDFVWVDVNGDGKQDPDETEGAPDVTVIVRDADGNEVTRTVTDENGKWKVDVEPGDYEIEYRPRDWTPTDPSRLIQKVTVEENGEHLDLDLGVQPKEPTPPEKEIVPTTVTKPVPTTVTKSTPTTVEKAVPTTVEKAVPTTVHTTTTEVAPKRGTIGDRVWIDENGDGKEDPNEKTGVPGVTVIVKDPEGKEVTRTVTDENGNWKVDVVPGDYEVEYVPGENTPSQPDQVKRNVTIKPGEKRDDVDLGVHPKGSVGDRVWNDEDGDGEQGEDEKGLENVIVKVSREGEPTRSAVTDENGEWKIEGLNPDVEYDIRFIKPEGWEVTGKVPGSDESGLVSKVTVKPNEYNDSYDLGLKKLDPGCDCEPVKPGTIGNRVWIDLNGNGKQDPNETEGAPDVTVIVRDADGNEVTRTVTDEDGNWKVNVEPGDYEIEYRPRDWKPTDPKRVTQKVTVEEGKEYLDLDLGVQKPKPGEPTPPTDEPAPEPEKGSSTETLDRCVANAVRSPLLYLVPVALLGAFGGEIARPYMGAINEQINQINAQFQEAMRRNSPDWGHGGRGGRDNDQFAELRGQIDAANRRIAELGQDPNVQRFGTVAAGIIGLIAAGGVLYDWCSNEKGEAFTSIGGSSGKDAA